VHARTGALYPYANTTVAAKVANADGYDWRINHPRGLDEIPALQQELQEPEQTEELVSAPLVLKGDLSATRFRGAGYGAWDGCTLAAWDCAAISHYSLFANLEQGMSTFMHRNYGCQAEDIRPETTDLYDFGTWDLHATSCERWSINFFIFYGWEIMDHMETLRKTGDDEPFVSQHICWATGHREFSIPGKNSKAMTVVPPDSLAVGKALVSHFSYSPQIDGMRQTDILPRYRSLAIEKMGYVID
jgi:hypothetical protein